jgi:hypothetical protein
MWDRTRDPGACGPNEQIIRADEARLAALARGEPVFGPRWLLCYRVHNFAPAVQQVAVEQQASDGTWQRRQACHTIEFQSRAAKPRGSIAREHAAPIDWDDGDPAPRAIRFTLTGVGEVRIRGAVLTDGVTMIAVRNGPIRLGRPAPRRGWPRFREHHAIVRFVPAARAARNATCPALPGSLLVLP